MIRVSTTVSHAEVVQDGSSSEDDNLDEDNAVTKSISPGHAPTPMLQERAVVDKVVSACISGGDEGDGVAGSDDIQPETEEFGLGCRKSKRQKKTPKSLLGNYECDKRFLNLARQTVCRVKQPKK
ncbi:unnamed protein product [Brassica oleracea]